MNIATHDDLFYRCPVCETPVKISESLIDDVIHCPNEDCGLPFRPELPSQKPISKEEIPEAMRDEDVVEKITAGNSDDEMVVTETHPALFRKHPLQTLGWIVLAVAGFSALFAAGVFEAALTLGGLQLIGTGILVWIGLAMFLVGAGALLVTWVQALYTTLTVTSKRTILRQGIIAKASTEVQHDDVRNLQIDQNALERFLGVGDLAISSSGQDDLEIYAEGIPSPEKYASIVRDMQ